MMAGEDYKSVTPFAALRQVLVDHQNKKIELPTPTLVMVANAVSDREQQSIERLVIERDRLLQALRPFALAANEVRLLSPGIIDPGKQWLWKPQNGNRDTAGISAEHVLLANNVYTELLPGH